MLEDSSILQRGSNARYWSSSSFTEDRGWLAEFSTGVTYLSNWNRIRGISIRCVAQ